MNLVVKVFALKNGVDQPRWSFKRTFANFDAIKGTVTITAGIIFIPLEHEALSAHLQTLGGDDRGIVKQV